MISLAYTQYGNLPLLQVISLTGAYGVSFLIAWFASVGNRAWEQRSRAGRLDALRSRGRPVRLALYRDFVHK